MDYNAFFDLMMTALQGIPGVEIEVFDGNGLLYAEGGDQLSSLRMRRARRADGVKDKEIWVSVREQSCIRLTVLSSLLFYEEAGMLEEEEICRRIRNLVPDPKRMLPPVMTGEECRNRLDEDSRELFGFLSELRKSQSIEARIPAYRIFTNRVLMEMSRSRPKTIEELRRIKGVGPVNSEKYGEEFLELIRAYDKADAPVRCGHV